MLADDVDPEFQADDEHVERKSQLGGRKQVRRSVARRLLGIPWKQRLLQFGCQEPEQGGSQKHPCDHLGNDLRLPEPLGKYPNDAAET